MIPMLKDLAIGYVMEQLKKLSIASWLRPVAGPPIQRALTVPTKLEPVMAALVKQKMEDPAFGSEAAAKKWNPDVARWRAQERVQVDIAFGRIDAELLRKIGLK